MIIDGPVKMPFPPPPPYTRHAPGTRPLPVPGAPTLDTSSIHTASDAAPQAGSSTNPFYNPDAPTPTSIRGPPPPFQIIRHRPTINDLPQHVLLQVIYTIVDPDLQEEEYRWGLYWLAVSLRLVSRHWYTACMHVLRSAYLPAYVSHIRPPYSANPYPLSSPASVYAAAYSNPNSPSPSTPALAEDAQRETAILDMFIAFQVRQNVLRDESELHLEAGHEGVKDLFELLQPRARTEDLVRKYGLRAGVLSVGTTGPTSNDRIPFREISVSFSARKVGIVRTLGGRKRTTLAEVRRERMESLESCAKRLVAEWVGGMDVIR